MTRTTRGPHPSVWGAASGAVVLVRTFLTPRAGRTPRTDHLVLHCVLPAAVVRAGVHQVVTEASVIAASFTRGLLARSLHILM